MRKITIAQRLMPFSHTPGAACLIPGTRCEIEAFPTLLRLGSIEVPLRVTGPVRGFTLQLDLERDCVWVSGQAVEDHFRLRIRATDAGFELFADRAPEGMFKKKETIRFPAEIEFRLPEKVEKLSLGSHKAQDWDLVWRRFDLREILPPLYLLGQKTPCAEEEEDKPMLPDELEPFCRARFSQLLVPRLIDEQHQGLCAPAEGDKYALLRLAYRQIRSFFFRHTDRRIALLPLNPFHEGRLIGVHAPGIGLFDLEWSKGVLRRAICRAEMSGTILLDLQKELKTYRIRISDRERGKRQKGTDPLILEEGRVYLLDQFQK